MSINNGASPPTRMYWELAPDFITEEQKQEQFQSHVVNLRSAVSKSRAALQRSITWARIISKKYTPLRSIVLYRSSGCSFWIERHLDPCLSLTYGPNPIHVPTLHHPLQCKHCLAKQQDNCLENSNEKNLYSTSASQRRVLSSRTKRRCARLAAERHVYHNRVCHVLQVIETANLRIDNASVDLLRLSAQKDSIKNGMYNTEMQFMTTRQQNAVHRESALFKTSSVHAFGQELELDKAEPALRLEIERATAALEKGKKEMEFLQTVHPLILHSFFSLSSWFKQTLRTRAGRQALCLLRDRVKRSQKSEDRVLYHLKRKLASEILERAIRCYFAKKIMFRLKQMKNKTMARRLQKW